MFENKEAKQTFIIIMSFVIVFILLFFLTVVPLTRKVYQQKDSLEESKLTLKRDLDNVDKYKEDLEYLNINSYLVGGTEVTDDNRVNLIEELENMAELQGLELSIETYNSVSSKNKKQEDAKTLLKNSVKGDYFGFMNFLYQLQNLKFEIFLESVLVEKFDKSKVKSLAEESIEDIPEIEGEIIIYFN